MVPQNFWRQIYDIPLNLRLVTMQKHIYVVKDVLRFENFVLLRKEIISLQTISNVLEIT
jgi:hypothetical protein